MPSGFEHRGKAAPWQQLGIPRLPLMPSGFEHMFTVDLEGFNPKTETAPYAFGL